MKILSLSEILTLFPEIGLFLQKKDNLLHFEGKYKLDSSIVVNVDKYITNGYLEKNYESHRKYYDLQIMIHGEEYVFVENCKELQVLSDYDYKKDIIFYRENENAKFVKITNRLGVLLSPLDAHKPCVFTDRPREVTKAVFKIPVEYFRS